MIDRTSLEGEFDFSVEFKRDGRAALPLGGNLLMMGFDTTQLAKAFGSIGLKIEPATAPFDILLIDQVQKPFLTPSSEDAR